MKQKSSYRLVFRMLIGIPKPAVVAGVVAFYLYGLSSSFAQSTRQEQLFEEVIVGEIALSAQQTEILDHVHNDSVTIRFVVVRVNSSSLLEANDINLNLFPNEHFMTITDKIDPRGAKDFSWHGNAPGHVSNILLTVFQQAVAGYIIIDDYFFNLLPIGNGLHVLVQVDPRKYSPCRSGLSWQDNSGEIPPSFSTRSTFVLPPNNNLTLGKGGAVKSSTSDGHSQTMSNTVIKVLVAYTTQAKNLAGGLNEITAIINNAKDAANASYTYSGVPIELQIVDTPEVSHSETSAFETNALRYCGQTADRSFMLIDFQEGNGAMASIPDRRGYYAGDVAVLLVAPGYLNGYGQAFDVAVPANEAFCVVEYDRASAAGNWTFAHEIGHLQGCRHQKSGGSERDVCNEPYPYGHGNIFYVGSDDFGTMMAVGVNRRVQRWSGPDVYYEGVLTGDATDANNALVLKNTATTVANFVKEVSGTINQNRTYSGIVSFTSNVTVTNNATLTIGQDAQIYLRDGVSLTINNGSSLIINKGADLKFGAGARLNIYGNLQATGTASQKITFTAFGTSWNGIYFASLSSGTIKYCTLNKLTASIGSGGITIVSGSNTPSIEYSTVDVLSGSYVFGICAAGNSRVYRSTIRSASGPALYAVGSSGYISVHDSDIIQTSSNPAIRAEGSGIVACWVAATIYDGKDKIKGGKLSAAGNGIINAGEASGSKDKNHFCDATSATLEVSSGGTIYARYDYWPNGNPPTQINNGGSIYYSNNLGASDCSDVQMMMASTDASESDVLWTKAGAREMYSFAIQDSSIDLRSLLFQAKDKARAGLYKQAAELFEQIIQSEHLPEAHTALLELGLLFRETQDLNVQNFIQTVAHQKGELEATAKKILADTYAFQKNQSEALRILDEIALDYPGTPDAFYAQLSKFYIHFEAGFYDEAAKVLDGIQPQSENDLISVAAARQLLSLETANANSTQPANAPPENSLPKSTTASSSPLFGIDVFPNPFNPEARIRYRVSGESAQEVSVLIFNTLGQQVRTLVGARQNPGDYSVLWDGRDNFGKDAPSGTYFLRIEAGGHNLARKLLLLR